VSKMAKAFVNFSTSRIYSNCLVFSIIPQFCSNKLLLIIFLFVTDR